MSLKKVAAVCAAMVLAGSLACAEEVSPNANRYLNAGGANLGVYGNNQAAGEVFADIMQSTVTMQRQFRAAMPSIINYSQTAHTQVSDSVLASSVCPTTMCAPNNRWVMWDTPFMVNETHKRDDGYLGYRQRGSGFATGISRMFDETTALGLAVGYDYRKLDGRDGYHMRNRADTFHAAVYGGTAVAWFFVDGYAGYSRSWNRTERNVAADINKANYNDTVWSAGMKASYVCILPNEWRITPAVGLDYSYVRMDSFTERAFTGGGATNLRIDKGSYHNIAMPITMSINKTYCFNFLSLGGAPSLWTPEVRGGYVPQFGNKRPGVKARFADGSTSDWKTRANEIGSYGTVGAGLKIKIRDKYIFGVDYDYSFASRYQKHTVTGTYGVSF